MDSSEAVENSYSYKAFGQPTVGQSDIANPYLFVGGYGTRWDGTPGLYYQAGTYYDPNTGISIDWCRYGRAQLLDSLPHVWPLCAVAAAVAVIRTNREHTPRLCSGEIPYYVENSFRHCMWMCELSRAAGEMCALWAETGHEMQNLAEMWWAYKHRGKDTREAWFYDTLHDLHNNLVGIDYRYRGATCFDSCNIAYNEFRLVPDDHVGWATF